MQKFGDYLKILRFEKSIKAAEVARVIDVSRAYIAAVESNKQTAPSFANCIKIAETLKLNSSESYRFFSLALQSRINDDTLSFFHHLDSISESKTGSYLDHLKSS